MQDKITLLNYDYSKWGIGEKVEESHSFTWNDNMGININNWYNERERQIWYGNTGVTTTQSNTSLTISGNGLSTTSNTGYSPNISLIDEMGTSQREYNNTMLQIESVLSNSFSDILITGTSAIHVDSNGTMRNINTI